MNGGIEAPRFHDKNVVVIGASRGLGRAIVAAAYAEGARVLAVARSVGSLKQLAAAFPGVQTLAGQAGITGHLKIGDGAIITAQSGIMNDVAPGEVLFGSPGRPHRQAMKLQALYGKLPEIYEALKTIKKKLGID